MSCPLLRSGQHTTEPPMSAQDQSWSSSVAKVLADAIFIENVGCKFQPQPGFSRHCDFAFFWNRRIFEQAPSPWHVFDHKPVRYGRDEMDVDLRQEVAGHWRIECLSHASNLHPLRHTAHPKQIEHGNITH